MLRNFFAGSKPESGQHAGMMSEGHLMSNASIDPLYFGKTLPTCQLCQGEHLKQHKRDTSVQTGEFKMTLQR